MSPEAWLARLGIWRLSMILIVLAGAAAIVTVPRLRAFYFRQGDRAGASLARVPVPAAAASAPSEPAGKKTGPRLLLPDADGRIRVRVSDRLPPRLPADGVPVGWTVKEFAGHASIELVRDEARLALRLRSEQSSFALYHDVVVDLAKFPFLSWSWKVARMPANGDVRERATDDEAAQVYVIFPRWPAPLKNSDVIGYVWDSRAPVGTHLTSTQAANVKIIVVASGPSGDGWRLEQRDVARDFATLFGRQPPRVGQVAVMIDTNDTRGTAEAFIGDLIFSRTRAESMESPTSMLR